MVQKVAPFRELFGRYVFGGILDRHPGLRVGWFEGGINWVPAALQDARAPLRLAPAHGRPRDRARPAALLGAPHVRVVHGRSARPRADRPDRRRPGDVVVGLPAQREHLRLLQRVARQRRRQPSARGGRRRSSARTCERSSAWTADDRRAHDDAPCTGPVHLAQAPTAERLDPDPDRMRRERGHRLRSIMRDQGTRRARAARQHQRLLRHRRDLAAGRRRPGELRAAGRRRARRRRAPPPVHAVPRRMTACEPCCRTTTCTGPPTSTSTRAWQLFACARWPTCCRPAHRSPSTSGPTPCAASATSPSPRPPPDAGKVISGARLIKTPDELACMREGLRITEQAIAEVQAQLAPGVRQTDLTATFLRAVFDAGADANILDPIWQVMPTQHRGRAVDHARRPRLPAADHRARAARGRRALGRHRHQLRRLPLRLRPHLDRRATSPTARQRAQFDKWRAIMDVRARRHPRRRHRRRPHRRRDQARAGERTPWMPHFYLGHGLGIDSAEMPYVGSDIGEAFDAALVLAAGHGARARAARLGRRRGRLPRRGGAPHHRGRVGTDDRLPVRPVLGCP